jgi:hypothetical protein
LREAEQNAEKIQNLNTLLSSDFLTYGVDAKDIDTQLDYIEQNYRAEEYYRAEMERLTGKTSRNPGIEARRRINGLIRDFNNAQETVHKPLRATSRPLR